MGPALIRRTDAWKRFQLWSDLIFKFAAGNPCAPDRARRKAFRTPRARGGMSDDVGALRVQFGLGLLERRDRLAALEREQLCDERLHERMRGDE